MPFGLCNAPATLKRAMQIVLAVLGGEVFVYLDDTSIASKSFDERLKHLREVFGHLQSASLCFKPSVFLCDEVPYLGHVISAQGVKSDPAKMEKVESYLVPIDVSGVRQFIGLASYYRCFVY